MTVNKKRLIDLAIWAAGEQAKKDLGLPSEWDQTDWLTRKESLDGEPTLACGTACCLAGRIALQDGAKPTFSADDPEVWATDAEDLDTTAWAQMPDGREVNVEKYAMDVLGLDGEQAYRLFYADNTLERVIQVVRELIAT